MQRGLDPVSFSPEVKNGPLGTPGSDAGREIFLPIDERHVPRQS